jgi:hypothetical protein
MAEVNAKFIFEGLDKVSPVIRKIHKEIKKATRDIKDKNKAVTESFRSLGGSIRTVALAAAAAGGGLFALVKSVANMGDEAIDASQKLGVSLKSYQRLAHAASMGGLSSEEFAGGLKILSRNLVDAASGGKETAAVFRALKINPRKSLGDTEKVLVTIADHFQQMPDGAKKTALAMTLFGKSGVEMIPFLNDGGKKIKDFGDQAESLGLVLSEYTAKQGKAFNDSIKIVGAQLRSLKVIIGAELLPIFEEVIQNTLAWFAANRELVKLKVKEFAQNLLEFLRWIKANGPEILATFKGIVDALGGITRIVKVIGVIWAAIFVGKVLKAAYSLFTLVGAVSKAFLGVAGVISGPVAAAVLSLAAIIGSVFLVVKRKEATKWLKDMGLGFLVDGSIIKLLEPIGQHFAMVWRSAGKDIEAIKGVAVAVFDAVGNHLSTVFVQPLVTVKNLFVEAFNAIKAAASGLFSDLAASLQSLDPNRFILRKIGIDLPGAGGLASQGAGTVSSAPPASIPAPVASAGGGRDLYARLSTLAQEISGQQQTLKKPQQVDLRIKVDSPVPTQVASISSSPGLNIKANTGQMIP